jgi:hypothetical protein
MPVLAGGSSAEQKMAWCAKVQRTSITQQKSSAKEDPQARAIEPKPGLAGVVV